jgi:excisionase family DNA binding protein
MLSKTTERNDISVDMRAFLSIKDASQRLGVHPDTLRRWVRRGKVPCKRHPINGYRLFDILELDRLLGQILGHE